MGYLVCGLLMGLFSFVYVGRADFLGYVYVYDELQAVIAVRSFAATVVGAVGSSDRYNSAGRFGVPDACGT